MCRVAGITLTLCRELAAAWVIKVARVRPAAPYTARPTAGLTAGMVVPKDMGTSFGPDRMGKLVMGTLARSPAIMVNRAMPGCLVSSALEVLQVESAAWG